jgi:hypothetical protein
MEIGRIDGLKLQSVNIGKCSDIAQEAFLNFCSKQKSIWSINIDHCRRILVDKPATSLSLFTVGN